MAQPASTLPDRPKRAAGRSPGPPSFGALLDTARVKTALTRGAFRRLPDSPDATFDPGLGLRGIDASDNHSLTGSLPPRQGVQVGAGRVDPIFALRGRVARGPQR